MSHDQRAAESISAVGIVLAHARRNWTLGLLLTSMVVGCAPLPPTTGVSDNAAVLSTEAQHMCPKEKITVTDLMGFQDAEGAWHVAGWINNQWDQPVNKIVTETEALNAAGQVIDHGEDVDVYPLNLQPSERAPFIAWIKRDFPEAERFRVEVDQCVPAEKRERGAVQVRKDRLWFDDAGRAEIAGELVNQGTKPVLVNGLSAALLDAAGNPIAAGLANVTSRYLGPGEHGPLRVTLDLPPVSARAVSGYQLFMDAVVTEARSELVDITHDLRVTERYLASDGRFHLIGEVNNRGDTNLVLRLQATLYEDPQRTKVLDAAFLDIEPALKPGETRSFDLADWGLANMQTKLAHELLERNPQAEVRVEPFVSWREQPKR